MLAQLDAMRRDGTLDLLAATHDDLPESEYEAAGVVVRNQEAEADGTFERRVRTDKGLYITLDSTFSLIQCCVVARMIDNVAEINHKVGRESLQCDLKQLLGIR